MLNDLSKRRAYRAGVRVLMIGMLSGAIAAHAAQPNGSSKGPLPAGVAATINGVPVTQAQIDAQLASSGLPNTPQIRSNIQTQLIERELVRQAAEKQHYDQRPEVRTAVNTALVGTENTLFMHDHVHVPAVTDAQVKARYQQVINGLGPNEYQASVITINDLAAAKQVVAQLDKGVPFDQLARRYSVAPSKSVGGQLPWIAFKTPLLQGNTFGLPFALAQQIVNLHVNGAVSSPILIDNKLIIVKLDAIRPTQIEPYDKAQAEIRARLEQAAQIQADTAVYTGLLKNASVVVRQ